MKKYRAELYAGTKYQLAEAPFYDAKTQILSWVDILGGKMYLQDAEGKIKSVDFGQMIGAAVPVHAAEGDLAEKVITEYIVAAVDGLYRYRKDRIEKIFDLSKVYEKGQRSNDAKADPEGRIWFGSVEYEEMPFPYGNLYSYQDGEVVCRQPNTRLANGMAWNRAADRFYFSDSIVGCVFVYDYDRATGNITDRRVLFEVEDGVPDGMCIDEQDNLWLAVWGGGRLEKRDGRTGEKLAEIEVPAVQVTSCCFYENAEKLLITTAGIDQSGEYDGCLFICHLQEQE